MDLIATAWRPGRMRADAEVFIPASYAGIGSDIAIGRITPVKNGGPERVYDPHIPQWNRVVPIVWREYVLSPAEMNAFQQAGLVQTPLLLPASFTQPGTAAVGG